ncbi:MAG: type I glyceraldehyde-3-phosphate dehydrogenase [Gammaproteobacteria bacterium]|nr:type I glyceraldehyde-3-phosphate dehydrogenase [Gammaproteobacteria bacterium]
MAIRVGINGFGRIGRLVLRFILERKLENLNVVAVNDLTDSKTLAHLFKYDSIHGQYSGEVVADDNSIFIDGECFRVFSESDPRNLPWCKLACDVVIESTGIFRKRGQAAQHLNAGAKKVIISAPAEGDVDATVVLGVNDHILTGEEQVISNASCTTNCLALMVKVLDDAFGLEKGFMTNIHAYTAEQNIQDAPHRDLRLARAAAVSIVPKVTESAKAVGLVLPHLQGKLDGLSLRVPVPDGALLDFTAVLGREVTVEEVTNAFKAAAEQALAGILQYTEEPLVSVDIIHNPHSCIFDALSTSVNGNLVKVMGWYDNEWGYSARVAELIEKVMEKVVT